MSKRRGKTSDDFVLDGSVAMAWYFKDEAGLYAKAVRKALSRRRAIVPGVWPLEVANTLVLAERRGRSTEVEASRWLDFLHRLPIRIDAETAIRAATDIRQLARSYDLSAYDAAYLELAIRLGLPLASLDGQLNAAARTAGVPQFRP